MAVSAVVLAGDLRKLSELFGRQQTIRNRDAQHRRIALDVEPIAQPQGTKLFLRQLTGEEALGLAAELVDALVHQPLINGVVAIHSSRRKRRAAMRRSGSRRASAHKRPRRAPT